MTAYKKASAGTTVEVANRTVLHVYGLGTIKMNLDQPGTKTKPVKLVAVAYVPGLSWNLLSTYKTVEQWGKPRVYYKTKAVLGFPKEESLVFNFCPRKGLFSATGVRRIPGQGEALAVVAKAYDRVEVHRMLAHPSEEIMQKAAQAMGVATTGLWRSCEARMQAKAKRQAVQWIDGPGKTGSDGVGDKDLDVKPDEDESVGRRRAPQLDVQELELKQQPSSRERKQGIQEAPPDPEEETREAPPNPVEGTQEATPDPAEETRKAPLDPEEKTREAPPDPEETREAPSDCEEKTREAPSDHEEETWEAPSDPELETREALSDPEEETREAPPDPDKETRHAPSDSEEETKDK